MFVCSILNISSKTVLLRKLLYASNIYCLDKNLTRIYS